MKTPKLAASRDLQRMLQILPRLHGVELDHLARALAAKLKADRLGPVNVEPDGAPE